MSTDSAVLHSHAPATTEMYGAALGAVLRRGDVLVLDGPLGAGKTCLVRGIVEGAGGDAAAVRSPTFVLHQPHRGARLTVHHLDLYRLGPGASVEVLDLDTLLLDGAAVLEWGGYADLRHLQPCTVSMAGGDDARPDQRSLRLVGPAPAHIAAAWSALQERVTAR
ncbi:MAG: tRNA (adenosine(37)-N6)-threonylcarbamoyltransferase complex ATPase subunit type 1 TsaE [Candidatus Dormibacteria bacterium]